jgi:hypothetical protein
MILGTDNEGREVTYDESTLLFAINGIATTPDRILAYDRGGQITWASDELRQWVIDTDAHFQQTARDAESARVAAALHEQARQQEVQRKAAQRVQQYEPQTIVSFAGVLKGLATLVIVLLIISGVIEGLALGAVTARVFPVGVLLFPVLFGGVMFLVGYLITLILKFAADLLLAVVQIEFNTRRD